MTQQANCNLRCSWNVSVHYILFAIDRLPTYRFPWKISLPIFLQQLTSENWNSLPPNTPLTDSALFRAESFLPTKSSAPPCLACTTIVLRRNFLECVSAAVRLHEGTNKLRAKEDVVCPPCSVFTEEISANEANRFTIYCNLLSFSGTTRPITKPRRQPKFFADTVV